MGENHGPDRAAAAQEWSVSPAECTAANSVITHKPSGRTQTYGSVAALAATMPVPALLVTADDVVNGKPAPDGYRLAAQRLGVDPSSCLVFEDAPPGIAAGQAAGCRVVGLTTTHSAEQVHHADFVIPDLTHVRVVPARDAFEVELR